MTPTALIHHHGRALFGQLLIGLGQYDDYYRHVRQATHGGRRDTALSPDD